MLPLAMVINALPDAGNGSEHRGSRMVIEEIFGL